MTRSLATDAETTVGQDPDDFETPVTLDAAALAGGGYVTADDQQRRTALLQDWCVQWAEQGLGFCYVHPRGPEPQELLARLPDERLDDVVWIDFGRDSLPDRFDVPAQKRVCIDALEGVEDGIEPSTLHTDPITARTTDYVAACSDHRMFDWNVARILTTVLPWVLGESGPGVHEVRPAIGQAGTAGTIDRLLELQPDGPDPTARAQLTQALDVDRKSFTTASQCLGWPRDPFPSNPLVGETTYPPGRALTEGRILLVTGALPTTDAEEPQYDAHRLGTPVLIANVVQRLWEAAQCHRTGEPFPLVLDGLVDLVPEPGVRLREILEQGTDTPLDLVASGPSREALPKGLGRTVSEHVDTQIVRVAGGTSEDDRSAVTGDTTIAERYLEREASGVVGEGPLWWVRTGTAGTITSNPRAKVRSRPAVPRDPPTARRDPEGVARAIGRSVDRYGAEPAWLPTDSTREGRPQ